MMVAKSIWRKTASRRRRFLAEFQMYLGESQGKCAEVLTDTAVELGLTKRTKAIAGVTLIRWAKGESEAPLWALQAACWYVVREGFTPEGHDSLDWQTLVATLLHRGNLFNSVEAALNWLPQHLDKQRFQQLALEILE